MLHAAVVSWLSRQKIVSISVSLQEIIEFHARKKLGSL